MIDFISPTPLTRIRALAARSRGLVAVPFLGADAASLLPLKSGSVLVTRVTLADVQQGLVSPKEVLRYMRAGVEVHSCANLHAKVYVFGKSAIVGSANVSATSMALLEAAVESTDPKSVAKATQFIEALRVDPVSETFVETLVRHYREDRVGGWTSEREMNAGPQSRKSKALHSKVWVMDLEDVDWDDDTKQAAELGRPQALERVADISRHRLEEIEWSSATWKELGQGDRVVQRVSKGRGFVFEPPARVVHVQAFRKGRAALVFLERRKRLAGVGSARVRQELGALASHFTRRGAALQAVRNAEAVAKLMELWPTMAKTNTTG